LGEGSFGGILAAVGQEAFADDNNIAQMLPGVEFAGGVNDEWAQG
jgi:hypothetical protein